jgi:hypothetical protein
MQITRRRKSETYVTIFRITAPIILFIKNIYTTFEDFLAPRVAIYILNHWIARHLGLETNNLQPRFAIQKVQARIELRFKISTTYRYKLSQQKDRVIQF